ncbi:hypothetical protein Egran_04680, partial [Elaphomyces granulatus]
MRQTACEMGHKGYCGPCKKSRYPRRNCSKNREICDYFNFLVLSVRTVHSSASSVFPKYSYPSREF